MNFENPSKTGAISLLKYEAALEAAGRQERDLLAQLQTASPYEIGEIKECLKNVQKDMKFLERCIEHRLIHRSLTSSIDKAAISGDQFLEELRRIREEVQSDQTRTRN
ncbi:hypothetical protein [Roseateles sp.]|jgi:hypothetical protein|uniref:hypothetical protein n=1 Tax=Roseateles sp. TaxID=1971397 RepID=UPI0039193C97